MMPAKLSHAVNLQCQLLRTLLDPRDGELQCRLIVDRDPKTLGRLREMLDTLVEASERDRQQREAIDRASSDTDDLRKLF